MQQDNKAKDAAGRSKNIQKSLFLLAAVFLLTLLLISSLALYYLSKDDYKSVRLLIENNINKQGYTLQYREISIKASFTPGITLDKAVFNNKYADKGNLLKAEELDISFKLIPLLLQKAFVVDSFTLNDAQIYIVRDESGNDNWLNGSQYRASKKDTIISLAKSHFRDVDIYYTGPTFVDKKITFNEALVSYSRDGALSIETAEGYIDQAAFSSNGKIDNLGAFLKGQGSYIVLDFELEQLLSLKLEGEIGSASLPTEKGVKTKVYGKNISTWLRRFVPELSDTDYFAIEGDIYSNGDKLSLDIVDAEFRRNKDNLKLQGSVDNLGIKTAVFDVSGSLQGDGLHTLPEWKFLDKSIQRYIPETDSYTFEFRVHGPMEKLSLSLGNASIGKAEHIVSISGDIKNLNEISGYAFRVQAIGNNMAQIQSQFFPELQADYAFPKTDEYAFSANLFGNNTDWEVSEISAELIGDNNQLSVYSQQGRVSDFNEIHLYLESSGSDLSELGSWFAYTNLPENIGHDMRFKLNGPFDALRLSELNAQLSYEESEVDLQGEVLNVNSMDSMKLGFDIVGKESEIALLLGMNDFQEKYVMAEGFFQGTLKTFSLSQFSYAGDRGKSSGDLFIDLNAKPTVKGNLGDTQLVFEAKPTKVLGESAHDEVFDFSWMDRLDVDIEYASLLIKAANAELAVLGSKILMKSGKLNWEPLQLNYKGKLLDGRLSINAATDELGFSARTNQIDLGALLKDLKWFERFEGLADFDMQLKSSGKNNKELVKNLHGKGKIIIKQATVKDFGSTNMSYIRTLMPWRKSIADLEISCLLSTVKVDQGVLRFEHLFMDNKNMYLTGGGKVDLKNSNIDMALAPRAKNRNFFDANISLFINGPVENPRVQVGKLSTVTDVGIKYGQWALLGPLALALPKLNFTQAPSCDQALGGL